MTPSWKAITDEADSEYNATLRYDAPWCGSEQLPQIGVGPEGRTDGVKYWTFTNSTNAPTGKFPGARRYLATPV